MQHMNVHSGESASLPTLISRYQQEQTGSEAFARTQLLALIYHSTALDGNSLTPDRIDSLSQLSKTGYDPVPDELLILDYFQGQQLITNWATSHEPLSLAKVQQVGACVMRQTGGCSQHFLSLSDSRQGEIRTFDLSAAGWIYERPTQIKIALQKLVTLTNSGLQKRLTARQTYELSFKLHAEFIRIHPFVEGNGRVARLLMNYVQQYANLPQSIVFVGDRKAYMSSLGSSLKLKSEKPFNDFMFGQLMQLLTLDPQLKHCLSNES